MVRSIAWLHDTTRSRENGIGAEGKFRSLQESLESMNIEPMGKFRSLQDTQKYMGGPQHLIVLVAYQVAHFKNDCVIFETIVKSVHIDTMDTDISHQSSLVRGKWLRLNIYFN